LNSLYLFHACYPSFHYPVFYQGSHNHPPLPSFPTRRSSDLPPLTANRALSPYPATSEKACVSPNRLLMSMAWSAAIDINNLFGRSEEHTSELQSRRDLVCRLLLEKKKR